MVRDDPSRDAISRATTRDAAPHPTWAAPASVVPSQFFGDADWRRVARGDVALRLAILEDAISCFERQFAVAGLRARRLGREAERWLFHDRPGPLSFRDVCDALAIEPAPLRRWLLARRAQHRDRRDVPRARRRHVVVRRGRSPRAA